MNIIIILLDSFRQDHVGFYHGGRPAFERVRACQTPNIDAFARECIVFDNAYPEALPTIPIRAQLFAGQRTLPSRPWQPLLKEDVSLAEILDAEGYVGGFITDNYHYRAPGMNYHRGFHASEGRRPPLQRAAEGAVHAAAARRAGRPPHPGPRPVSRPAAHLARPRRHGQQPRRHARPQLSARVRGETDSHRDAIITGYYEAPDRCIRDQTWSYVQRPPGQPDELYHLRDDPRERRNLIDEYPDEARRLAAAFGSSFRRRGAASEVKGIQGKYELASGNVE